jgi:hypothetical protein
MYGRTHDTTSSQEGSGPQGIKGMGMRWQIFWSGVLTEFQFLPELRLGESRLLFFQLDASSE